MNRLNFTLSFGYEFFSFKYALYYIILYDRYNKIIYLLTLYQITWLMVVIATDCKLGSRFEGIDQVLVELHLVA